MSRGLCHHQISDGQLMNRDFHGYRGSTQVNDGGLYVSIVAVGQPIHRQITTTYINVCRHM
jgi:hypothetical protein